MEQEELYDEAECVICGNLVDPALGTTYVYGAGDLMCYECAVKRGGAYDEDEDRWLREPDIAGLPDERRAY